MSDELVRVSDADRELAVSSLREHLVQGRLSLEEFTQRMTSAYDAKTSTDLAELERDLTGLALFGSKETRGKPGTLRSGAALVRVNAFVLFGSTEVQVKTPR